MTQDRKVTKTHVANNMVGRLKPRCAEADFVGDAVGAVEVSAATVPEVPEV